jgi:hypothetical protein
MSRIRRGIPDLRPEVVEQFTAAAKIMAVEGQHARDIL